MTQTAKHTPGPWKAIFEYKYCPRVLIGEPIEFEDKSGFHQCEVHLVNNENSQADALLIAAAPDMAEALKDCVDIWSSLGDESERWLSQARAALAKAGVQ